MKDRHPGKGGNERRGHSIRYAGAILPLSGDIEGMQIHQPLKANRGRSTFIPHVSLPDRSIGRALQVGTKDLKSNRIAQQMVQNARGMGGSAVKDYFHISKPGKRNRS